MFYCPLLIGGYPGTQTTKPKALTKFCIMNSINKPIRHLSLRKTAKHLLATQQTDDVCLDFGAAEHMNMNCPEGPPDPETPQNQGF